MPEQKSKPIKVKEWYKHGWGLVAAIFLFPYFLIWYAWAKSNWNQNFKIGITALIAVIMLPFIIAAAVTRSAEPAFNQDNVVVQEESFLESQKELEANKVAEETARLEAEKKLLKKQRHIKEQKRRRLP